jgi:hypothetical protein
MSVSPGSLVSAAVALPLPEDEEGAEADDQSIDMVVEEDADADEGTLDGVENTAEEDLQCVAVFLPPMSAMAIPSRHGAPRGRRESAWTCSDLHQTPGVLLRTPTLGLLDAGEAPIHPRALSFMFARAGDR